MEYFTYKPGGIIFPADACAGSPFPATLGRYLLHWESWRKRTSPNHSGRGPECPAWRGCQPCWAEARAPQLGEKLPDEAWGCRLVAVSRAAGPRNTLGQWSLMGGHLALDQLQASDLLFCCALLRQTVGRETLPPSLLPGAPGSMSSSISPSLSSISPPTEVPGQREMESGSPRS